MARYNAKGSRSNGYVEAYGMMNGMCEDEAVKELNI